MGTDILLSGAVLSSMLFDNINHMGIGEGFLLGEVDKITTQNITDTQICLENSHYMTSISGYLPCSSLQAFYSGSGQLKVPNIREILGDNFLKVIGWYRCRGRCNTIFKREALIHEQLSKLMNRQDFVLALFSSPSDSVDGTMNTFYKFYAMQNKQLVGSTYKIVNMSETSSTTYYKESPNTHLYASRALEKSLKYIDNLEPGVKDIQDLYNRLLNQLKEMLPDYFSICEKQSKCVTELMKIKSQCHASGMTPNYVATLSQEPQKIAENIINNPNEIEVSTNTKDSSSPRETVSDNKQKKASNKTSKKAADLKLGKSGSIMPKFRSMENGTAAKKVTKQLRTTQSMSPSPKLRKAINAAGTSINQSKKSEAVTANSIKSQVKCRPLSISPKCNKSLSASPEF